MWLRPPLGLPFGGVARSLLPLPPHLYLYSQEESQCPSYGLREKTRVWKPGRSVAETRTRSTFWVYMTYRDLVMAALSWWWLIFDF